MCFFSISILLFSSSRTWERTQLYHSRDTEAQELIFKKQKRASGPRWCCRPWTPSSTDTHNLPICIEQFLWRAEGWLNCFGTAQDRETTERTAGDGAPCQMVGEMLEHSRGGGGVLQVPSLKFCFHFDSVVKSSGTTVSLPLQGALSP